MKSRNRSILAALLAVFLLSACQSGKKTPAAIAPRDPSIVSVSDALLSRLKVIVAGEEAVAETMRVPARIEMDEHRVARVGAAVTGRVAGIFSGIGEKVTKGALLAQLNSTELSSAQLAYLKAGSQETLQENAVKRARLLYESDVISAAELQKRESEWMQAQAERMAAQDQLKVLGMTGRDLDALSRRRSVHSLSSVTAPIDGTVVERKVAQGQVMQPADPMFTIADLSRLWLVAEIPEQQAADVRTGGDVMAEISALPGQAIGGRLIFVSDTVKPDTRTVTARMAIDNPGGGIKPGMLASMLVKGKAQNRVMVPMAAVVRENNRDHVFVRLDAHRFQMRAVKLGQEEGGFSPALEGLRTGESIVTDGAFHLDSERRRKALEG